MTATPAAAGSTVALAYVVAKAAHDRQVDKSGNPYFGHPLRVGRAILFDGLSDEHVAVGYLHDVLEDTVLRASDLELVGFSPAVIEAVEAITQRKNEPRDEYYARVLANPIARVVKRYDVLDNTSEERMALLPPDTQERLRKKYTHALTILG